MGRQAPGAEHHVEVGRIAGQCGHQGAAAVNAGLEQGFIEGGIGHQHRQSAVFGGLAAIRVHLHHQQRHPFAGELLADFAADAAIAAEDHMVVHGGKPADETAFAQTPEIAGFRQAQDPLDGELHHHQATHQRQGGDHPTSAAEHQGVGIAEPHGAEGHQHHPVTVAPVPAFGDAVSQGRSVHQHQQGNGRLPRPQ